MKRGKLQASECQRIFERVYRGMRRVRALSLEVDFYPYADLDHTIRMRRGRLLVRLSDIAMDASEEVIEALAHILLGKILHRQINPRYEAVYGTYSHSPQVLAETAHTRALRGRPSPGDGMGQHSDLTVLFNHLNAQYFGGTLQGVNLLWSKNRSLGRLGYYRHTFHTIVISRALDDPRVPRFVLEFILYHEMLHASIPSVTRNGRRYDHTTEFKAAERQFERYHEATKYLRQWPPPEFRRGRPAIPRLRQLRLF